MPKKKESGPVCNGKFAIILPNNAHTLRFLLANWAVCVRYSGRGKKLYGISIEIYKTNTKIVRTERKTNRARSNRLLKPGSYFQRIEYTLLLYE